MRYSKNFSIILDFKHDFRYRIEKTPDKTCIQMNIDLQILKTLNNFISDKGFWYHVINVVGNNPFVRGTPILACLAIVSLSQPSAQNKSKIFLGFIGTFVALIISVYCQSHLSIHLRPIFDKAINIPSLFDWVSA